MEDEHKSNQQKIVDAAVALWNEYQTRNGRVGRAAWVSLGEALYGPDNETVKTLKEDSYLDSESQTGKLRQELQPIRNPMAAKEASLQHPFEPETHGSQWCRCGHPRGSTLHREGGNPHGAIIEKQRYLNYKGPKESET